MNNHIEALTERSLSLSTPDLEFFAKQLLNIVEERKEAEAKKIKQEYTEKLCSLIKEIQEKGYKIDIFNMGDLYELILKPHEDFWIGVE